MPMETTVNVGVRSLERPQTATKGEGAEKREVSDLAGAFSPKTNVAIKSAVSDMAGVLAKIATTQSESTEAMPETLQKLIQNIMKQSFSMPETLAKGLGSTVESQRFSLEQLSSLSRMLLQLSNLAEHGVSAEASDTLEVLLSNLKQFISTNADNAFEPVILNKAAFALLDGSDLQSLPHEVKTLLTVLQAQNSGVSTNAKIADNSSLGFVKQLVQYFMPRPATSATATSATTSSANTNQPVMENNNTPVTNSTTNNTATTTANNSNGNISGNSAANSGATTLSNNVTSSATLSPTTTTNSANNMTNSQNGLPTSETATSNTNLNNTASNTANNSNTTASQGNQANQVATNSATVSNGNTTQLANTANTQVSFNSQAAANEVQPELAANNNANNSQVKTNNLADQATTDKGATNDVLANNKANTNNPQATVKQPNTLRQVNPGNSFIFNKVTNENTPVKTSSKVVNYQATLTTDQTGTQATSKATPITSRQELMLQAKGLLMQQELQNTPQTMKTLRDLAQVLLEVGALNQADTVVLQNFVQSNQTQLSDKESKLFQNLIRLCQANIPATVQRAAVEQDVPDLPRVWAFMQLCDMSQLKKLSSKQLKKASQDVASLVLFMRHASEGDNSVAPNQRSLNFMLPLYMSEDTTYPTYIHVYDERQPDRETGELKKETWLRVCFLTDNIGAVELTCRIYNDNQLDMRLLFSSDDVAAEFQNEVIAVRSSLRKSTLNLNEFKINGPSSL